MTTETTTRLLPFACGLKWKHLLVAMILYFGGSYYALQAQPFSEYFDDPVPLLPGNGWAFVNASNPLGITGWEQGDYITFTDLNGGGIHNSQFQQHPWCRNDQQLAHDTCTNIEQWRYNQFLYQNGGFSHRTGSPSIDAQCEWSFY
ncbi:MAG TPA: hypothetical protein PLI34_01605 [Saprospiraceae bacterium]|nr:hypothetical protein [Saprospiraceae bacterium]HRK82245.1 hypothetical protein [Saprospiraceae bacterium]